MKIMHQPVLMDEVLEMLQIKKDGAYLDGTLGDGGHAELILSKLGAGGLLVALDRDENSLSYAKKRLQSFGSKVKFFHENFTGAKKILEEEKIGLLDGIIVDLGVSSRQLDTPERGFSFSSDAFLDMRMDQRGKTTAFDIINYSSEKELADIFKDYGEERWAKRIAKRIAIKRKNKEIRTTGELNKIIISAVPVISKKYKIHPSTRVFQALRIAVNKELDALTAILDDGVECLKGNGRFCVISFHSLEDRIVKRKFRRYARGCICPTDIPQCVCGKKKLLKIITKRPIVPSEDETRQNIRARSAKLRVAEKICHLSFVICYLSLVIC